MPNTPDKASEAEKFRTIDIDALIKERDDWKRACEQHLKTISRQISTLSTLPLHAPDKDGNRRRWVPGEMPWVIHNGKVFQPRYVMFDGGNDGWWVEWYSSDLRRKATMRFKSTHPTRELAEQAAKGESDA